MANLVNIWNVIIALFILNSLPCSNASDSNIDYSCHKEIPSQNSNNRKYIQLCDKIVHADIEIACKQHNASVASKEQLDNVVFNNPQNFDTSEFWIASESSKLSDPLGKSNNSVGNANDRLSYDGQRINKNGNAIKHCIVCEQDQPLTKMTKGTELKPGSMSRGTCKHIKKAPKKAIGNANEKLGRAHIKNKRKKRSTHAKKSEKVSKKSHVKSKKNTTPKPAATFTGFTSTSNGVDVNTVTSLAVYTAQDEVEVSSNEAIVATMKDDSTSSKTHRRSTRTTTEMGTDTTSSKIASVTPPKTSASKIGFTTNKHLTSIPTTVPSTREATTAATKTVSEYFECSNGKLWRTFDLTDRGEYCLGTTARSKLECLVFSQQHKCPHAFYEMTTNTCQLFYKKISHSTQTKQLDCSRNFCYTCI